MRLLLIFIVFFSFSSNAENCEAYTRSGLILAALQCLEGDKGEWSEYERSILYSFVGMNDKSDTIINPSGEIAPNSTKKQINHDISAYEAVTTIAELSKGRRVVMVNESHHQSFHRLFALDLARKLKSEGFTHFAMEGLSQATATQRQGYSTYSNPVAGIYTADPAFAYLINESIKLGYTLHSYEAYETKSVEEREEKQAENLKNILDSNPKMKLLVYVGYSHIQKNPSKNGIQWMANRFIKKTGIIPFTVDQVAGTYIEDKFQNDYVLDYIDKKFALDSPAVFKMNKSNWLRPLDYQGDADIVVFHPFYKYSNDRPSWIKADRHRIKIDKNIIGDKRPVLIRAVHLDHGSNAVPIDQFVAEAEDINDLFLPAGRYRLEVERDKKIIKLGQITVGGMQE